MRIYLDTVTVIYLIEKVAPQMNVIRQRLAAAKERPVISDLTRMECQVLPLRMNDQALIQDFRSFFGGCEVAPLDASVYDRAAEIRAVHNFKTIDSIHLAAAVVSACDVFLTEDQKLARFPDLAIDLI